VNHSKRLLRRGEQFQKEEKLILDGAILKKNEINIKKCIQEDLGTDTSSYTA
jgi:hypothetical protein